MRVPGHPNQVVFFYSLFLVNLNVLQQGTIPENAQVFLRLAKELTDFSSLGNSKPVL